MSTDTSGVVQYVLSSLKRAAENAYSWSLTPNEAGILVAEVEWLRREVAWLRSPILPDEVCAACGHKKFYHFDYRQRPDAHDATKCFGRGLDCDDCASRCECFVRGTHTKEKP